MMDILRVHVAMAGVALLLGGAAQAAVVAEGGTGSAGAGGFSVASGNPVSDVFGPYSAEITDPASDWVWTNNSALDASETFLFTFDLTGFDLSTAAVSGKWGVDNLGLVRLNGTILSTLLSGTVSAFTSLTSFGTSDSGLFLAGVNTLSFEALNDGGTAAFRASVRVTADALVSPPEPPPGVVPLPATLPLLLGVLAVAGFGAARRRRASDPGA